MALVVDFKNELKRSFVTRWRLVLKVEAVDVIGYGDFPVPQRGQHGGLAWQGENMVLSLSGR